MPLLRRKDNHNFQQTVGFQIQSRFQLHKTDRYTCLYCNGGQVSCPWVSEIDIIFFEFLN